jgi:hypothetical protein
MRKAENTSQDVATRSDRNFPKETFSIGYYFVDNFLSRAATGRVGTRGESQKIKEGEKKTWAYLYKLCQGKQRRQKQIFKLLPFTYY